MRIAVLYNPPASGAGASDQDVLVQRDAVTSALEKLGHDCFEVPCTLDLSPVAALTAADVDCVFNLVEALAGTDRLQALVPVLLEGLQIPHTGSSAASMLDTCDKVTVKERLRELRLPTADWMCLTDPADVATGRFIVKARFEHASIGMDDAAVVDVSSARMLHDLIVARSEATGVEMFAERFVEGREFNLSVIADASGHGQVLAPAEIDFTGYPADRPKIIGYDAKWTEASIDFNATPRTFSFEECDQSLLQNLTMLSETIWRAFALGGYARIDYRVDRDGQPQVLEINTNPCLSPDAGFVAAVQASGHDFCWAIERIVEGSLDVFRGASGWSC